MGLFDCMDGVWAMWAITKAGDSNGNGIIWRLYGFLVLCV